MLFSCWAIEMSITFKSLITIIHQVFTFDQKKFLKSFPLDEHILCASPPLHDIPNYNQTHQLYHQNNEIFFNDVLKWLLLNSLWEDQICFSKFKPYGYDPMMVHHDCIIVTIVIITLRYVVIKHLLKYVITPHPLRAIVDMLNFTRI